ncbi:MAG: YaeQ family protein [Nitrospira sp.]|nr:YaeQ family protein [Nitrospira sp.]
MAPNATIFKATLHIADMDRHYYEDHTVTLARHPSETDERMMVRLLAFSRHAHDALLFGRGIGSEGEPALWQKDLTGAIDLWIEVGEPDEKIIRQACGRATRVVVYSYGGRGADRWWEKTGTTLSRCTNLTVVTIPQDESRAMAHLAQRSMDLHCSIQDGQILMGDGTTAVQIELATIHSTAI